MLPKVSTNVLVGDSPAELMLRHGSHEMRQADDKLNTKVESPNHTCRCAFHGTGTAKSAFNCKAVHGTFCEAPRRMDQCEPAGASKLAVMRE